MSALAAIPHPHMSDMGLQPALALNLAQLATANMSPNTQRAYTREITLYLSRGCPLTREYVQQHIAARKSAGAGPVTCNIGLAALKLLAREAEVRGLLSPADLHAIDMLRGQPIRGQKLGNWTDEDGVEKLLAACKNSRERALIAILCGCGLRRAEVAGLTWEQYTERAYRKVLADVTGKGGRVRTVAVPVWAVEIIEEYQAEVESAQA